MQPLNEVFSGYISHNDSKSEGEIGLLRKRHLRINSDSIHCIGKESNELEKSEFLGVFKENTLEYVNFQKRLRKIIEKLTLKISLELGIPRRTYFDWKKKIKEGKQIKLKKKISKKILVTA